MELRNSSVPKAVIIAPLVQGHIRNTIEIPDNNGVYM